MKLAEEKTKNMNQEELETYWRLSRQSVKLFGSRKVLEFARVILKSLVVFYLLIALLIVADYPGLNWPTVRKAASWLVPGLLAFIVHMVFQRNKVTCGLRRMHLMAVDVKTESFQPLSGLYRRIYGVFYRKPFLFTVPLLLFTAFFMYATLRQGKPFWAIAGQMVLAEILNVMFDVAGDTAQFDLEDFWKAYDRRLAKPTLFDL